MNGKKQKGLVSGKCLPNNKKKKIHIYNHSIVGINATLHLPLFERIYVSSEAVFNFNIFLFEFMSGWAL
jgi:hypothetical protein